MKTPELVVLVDENDNECGTMLKSEVHQKVTPLHRAFSVFLFHRETKKLLLQQRSGLKKTWPLIWSDSVCGHPLPGEACDVAICRRMAFELNINSVENLSNILPDYRYRATYLGVEENEICPVWVGSIDAVMSPNPDEVEAVMWVDWGIFAEKIKNPHDTTYDHLSPWCQEEVVLLSESEMFCNWYEKLLS